MAIKHTAVSYYGINYVEHAIADFKEMKEHGCDTVILAITEFNMDFWFPNINNIVKAAHELGLRVIADSWGIGKMTANWRCWMLIRRLKQWFWQVKIANICVR